MADKKKHKKKEAKISIEDQLIEAALKRAVQHRWHSLSMADLSSDTGIDFNEIHTVFSNRAMILKGYIHRLDHRVLDHYEEGETDSTRDKIFDLMMRRFDEFHKDKLAIKEITKQARNEPDTLCITGCGLWHSMRKLLKTAGVRISGVHGRLRIQALSLVFAKIFRIWLEDETDEMSKTMAALDKELERAEKIELCVCRLNKVVTT